MTPNDFHKKMEKLRDELKDDPEVMHQQMDDLMCRVLQEQGFWKGVEIFQKSESWYA